MAGMNAGLILQGQGIDPVNALARGAQGAATVNAVQDQNAMRDMFKANGAGIMAGDQSALNAFARLDPNAALGVQNTHLGMDQTRQSMAHANERQAMLSREEKRNIEAHAANMSAEQRAAEAAKLKGILNGAAHFHSTGDEQGYNDYLARNEIDPRNPEYSFNNFPSTAARYGEVLETLETFQDMNAEPEPVKPNSSIGKLQADLASGAIDQQQYDLALQNMAPSGMQITSDGEGGFSLTQGAGVGGVGGNGKDLTVEAAKNTGFLIRARESQNILNELENEGTSFTARLKSELPFGVGNYFQSEEYQRYDQAKRDMINAILRRESGAVIADSEFVNADRQYFPQPGDSPEVIEQKRQNRENAIAGMEVGSGDGVNRIASPAEPVVIDGYTITVVE